MTMQKKAVAKKPRAAEVQKAPAKPAAKPGSKLGRLESMLRRPQGATIDQIAKALDWQSHSVRGTISGALKKKQGLAVVAEKVAGGGRVYRIVS